MNNPFEAAIEFLEDTAQETEDSPERSSFYAAIAFLEAGAKMPEARERLLPHFSEELSHISCYYCRGIRDILAALPAAPKGD